MNISPNKSNFSKVFKNSSDLNDVISLVLHCPEDKTFLVAHDTNLDYHIPYVSANKFSWNLQIQCFIREYTGLSTEKNGKLWRTVRFWRSDDEPFLTNVIFQVPVSIELKRRAKIFKLNKYSRTAWMSMNEFNDLYKSPTNLMSPDVAALLPIEDEGFSPQEIYSDSANVLSYNLIEVTRDHVISTNRTSIFDNMSSSLSLSVSDVITLHNEYLKYTYPNILMGRRALIKFGNIVGWNEYLYKTAFRGADMTDKGGLAFKEFLHLIYAIDPNSEFKGYSFEARNRFIFRCFDVNRDNLLSPSEFTALIVCVRASLAPDAALKFNVEAEMEHSMKAMELRPGNDVPLSAFIRLSGTLKRGYFQNILRASIPIMTFIASMKERTISNVGSTKGSLEYVLKFNKSEYTLSSYVSRVHRGNLTDIIDIDKMEGIQVKEMKGKLERTPSADMFLKKILPQNELLSYLKYYTNPENSIKDDNENEDFEKLETRKSATNKEEFSWGTLNLGRFIQCLMQVCKAVIKLFQSEKRMLLLKAPVYVVGDLHGNIQDLCCLEREIWPLGITLLPGSVLFLGDYVDRGENSIETVAYLLAHKARAPQTVYLLRGNHELRSTQLQQATYNTFFKECTKRFGTEMGKQLWNAVNDVFDYMPLAACVDGKIFCCHGGIPPPWMCPTIQSIQTIPCPLPSPENNAIAWELLWNDPSRESELSDKVKIEMLSNQGFSTNVKRSTGHIFNEKALEKFFQNNQLSFLIRAHESQKAGFQVHHNWKVLTVFSSSFYNGANKAACVLIQNTAKIKILQLTTDDYHPDKARGSKSVF